MLTFLVILFATLVTLVLSFIHRKDPEVWKLIGSYLVGVGLFKFLREKKGGGPILQDDTRDAIGGCLIFIGMILAGLWVRGLL